MTDDNEKERRAIGWPTFECPWCSGKLDTDNICNTLEETGDDELRMTCPRCGFELLIVWEGGEDLPSICKH